MRFQDTLGISHLIKLVEHELSLKVDGTLQAVDLTMAQYSTLSALESEEKLTNAELARKCSVTPQTMNRILQNLEKQALVKKSLNPEHALKQDFVLTKKAHKLICEAHALVNEVEKEFISILSTAEYDSLKSILNKTLKPAKAVKNSK